MIARKRLLLAVQFACFNINQKRKRVGLAVIGVAIGIAAVSSMLLFGYSVEAKVRQSLDSLGADVITVVLISQNLQESQGDTNVLQEQSFQLAQAFSSSPPGHVSFAINLLKTMPEVEAVSRLVKDPTCRSEEIAPSSITEMQFIDVSLFKVLSLDLAQGRYLMPGDAGQSTVVVGSDAIKKIRTTMPSADIGSVVSICGKSLTIAGILVPHAGREAVPMARMNQSVLRIFSQSESDAANDQANTPIMARLYQKAFSRNLTDTISHRLKAALNSPVSATGAQQLGQLRKEQTTLYTRFLAVLGSISLLVGSLGIANVMLVSVSERRAEIGLRMAIGANKLDIVLQFLIESAAICLIGALLGLIVGSLGAAGALYFANISLSISPTIVMLSCGLAVLCGLFAGAYPARLAAEVDPIASLRGGG